MWHPGCSCPRATIYSPIPDLDEVRRDEQRVFPPVPHELPGIALDEARQLAMLDELQPYYDSQPFDAKKTRNLRYFFENPSYSYRAAASGSSAFSLLLDGELDLDRMNGERR